MKCRKVMARMEYVDSWERQAECGVFTGTRGVSHWDTCVHYSSRWCFLNSHSLVFSAFIPTWKDVSLGKMWNKNLSTPTVALSAPVFGLQLEWKPTTAVPTLVSILYQMLNYIIIYHLHPENPPHPQVHSLPIYRLYVLGKFQGEDLDIILCLHPVS